MPLEYPELAEFLPLSSNFTYAVPPPSKAMFFVPVQVLNEVLPAYWSSVPTWVVVAPLVTLTLKLPRELPAR